jgi:hypothetical protein
MIGMMWGVGEALWGSLSYSSPGFFPCAGVPSSKPLLKRLRLQTSEVKQNLVMILILIQSDFRRAWVPSQKTQLFWMDGRFEGTTEGKACSEIQNCVIFSWETNQNRSRQETSSNRFWCQVNNFTRIEKKNSWQTFDSHPRNRHGPSQEITSSIDGESSSVFFTGIIWPLIGYLMNERR